MHEEFLFVEKYRPKTLSECILPDHTKSVLNAFVDKREIPNLLFEGPPGTGKTSAAIAMCNDVGIDWIMINASKQRGIDVMRNEIVDFASTLSVMGGKKCVILDEVDNTTYDSQKAFLGVVEEFSQYCTFILTCNHPSKILDAIISRMMTINFRFGKEDEIHMKSSLFVKIQQILTSEGIEYHDKAIAKLIEKLYPDFRRILGELQKLSANGKFLEDSLSGLGGSEDFLILIGFLKTKDFRKMREWVASHDNLNDASIYRKLYDNAYEYFDPHSIPQVVLLIAKYQYQHALVADPEVNLVAFFVEMMLDVKFR